MKSICKTFSKVFAWSPLRRAVAIEDSSGALAGELKLTVVQYSLPPTNQISETSQTADRVQCFPAWTHTHPDSYLRRSASAPIPLSSGGRSPSLRGPPSEGEGRSVMTQESTRGSPPTPPLHDPLAVSQDAEGWLTLELALFAYSGALMVGTLAEIKDVVGCWGIAAKLVFCVVGLGAIGSLGSGLMASGYRGSPMGRRRSLSAFCARFSTILFTGLFIVVISCKFGHGGCVAGVFFAVAIGSLMIVIWVPKKFTVAVFDFLGFLWFWGEGPPVAQSTELTTIQIQKSRSIGHTRRHTSQAIHLSNSKRKNLIFISTYHLLIITNKPSYHREHILNIHKK